MFLLVSGFRVKARNDKEGGDTMINTKHLVKVMMAWISIVYVVCYFGVAMMPSSRMWYMRYALHADSPFTSSYFGLGYFLSGLIIWNVVIALATWLFATLFNSIKK